MTTPAIDVTIQGLKAVDAKAVADNSTMEYLVIIISSIGILCVCISLIFAHYLWIRRQKSVIGNAGKIHVVLQNDNEHHNSSQHISDVSRSGNDSMSLDRNEGVAERHKNYQKEIKYDKRKEGEEIGIDEVVDTPDTDVGDV